MRALYTIDTETAQVRYAGNDATTVFPVTFQFFEPTTLRVRSTVGDVVTLLTLNTDYTVSGGDGQTGSITVTPAPASGTNIIIDLDIPTLQQTIDLSPNGPLPAEDVEQGFDRIVTMVKQLRQQLRAVPELDATFNPDTDQPPILPPPSAGEVLIGREDEAGWENGTIASLNPADIPVVIANPLPGQFLKYSGSSWANAGLATNVVDLDNFVAEVNPLQAALDFLGQEGGTITFNGVWNIPAAVTSLVGLRNFKLMGLGIDAALIFSQAGGGLRLHMAEPSPGQMQRDQCAIQDCAILTTYRSASGTSNGAGYAVYASWAKAVGDVTQGATFRNVQIGCLDHDISGGQYARWTCGVRLHNARQNTFDNCYFWGGTAQRDGIAIELSGGTVQTQILNCNMSDLDEALYAHGVSEGIQWRGGAAVGVNFKIHLDGDLVGDVRTTSASSVAIGTGTKAFTINHSAMEGWQAPALRLYIRSAANPTVNYMTGIISDYSSGNAITVAVDGIGGSGTHTDWEISPEHYISQVEVTGVHGSAAVHQVFARWAAFVDYHNNMTQKREGTSENYTDINLVDHVRESNFGPGNHFSARGSGGTTDGIHIQDDPSNTLNKVYDNKWSGRDKALWPDGAANKNTFTNNTNCGDITEFIANYSGTNTANKFTDNNDPAITDAREFFPEGDTTPSVRTQNRVYRTNNGSGPVTITFFDDGIIGQEFRFQANDANTTLTHSANLLLVGGTSHNYADGKTSVFVKETATTWREYSRSAT